MEPTEPAKGILETVLGDVEYTVNQGDHVYLDAFQRTGPLLVNRVEYNTSLHLFLIDGVWKTKNYHDLHMWRPNQINSDVSFPAQRKAQEILTAAWTEFISEHPELLVQGEIYYLTQNVHGIEGTIAKKQAELKELDAERQRHLARLHELGYYGPNKQDWSARS